MNIQVSNACMQGPINRLLYIIIYIDRCKFLRLVFLFEGRSTSLFINKIAGPMCVQNRCLRIGIKSSQVTSYSIILLGIILLYSLEGEIFLWNDKFSKIKILWNAEVAVYSMVATAGKKVQCKSFKNRQKLSPLSRWYDTNMQLSDGVCALVVCVPLCVHILVYVYPCVCSIFVCMHVLMCAYMFVCEFHLGKWSKFRFS